MAFGDFVYYTLLKHGRVIIVVLGIIIILMVVTYSQKFGIGMEKTSSGVLVHCNEDIDCFEHCGECVSLASARYCEPDFERVCVCLNKKCQIAKPF